MTTVYVVVENGELYPVLYSTYEAARKAVITKYTAEPTLELAENETGTTQLYTENGTVIIQRYLQIRDRSGGPRKVDV
jgi:hypothetical protein